MESFDSRQIVVPSEFQEKILTGELVQLWPWARGYYKRDLLHDLWVLMEREEMTETIFYAKNTTGETTPVPIHMDLIEFVAYWAANAGSRLLMIPTDRQTGEIVGFSWFDNVILGDSGHGSMFYRKKYWGAAAKEASVLSLKYGFEVLGFKKVWGYSPWLASVKHRARLGFREVTEIPDALTDRRGKVRTMFIGECLKEDFYATLGAAS